MQSPQIDIQLHPCGEFTENSCCSNVAAQEIGDGFEHLMNIGGSGGTPVDDERCFQHAKSTFLAMKDYFCLFCNPRHINYLGCCKPQYRHMGECKDPAGVVTSASELMWSNCSGQAPDTIRVCDTFATELWGTDGSKYDSCGMMMWVPHDSDSVAPENAWSDPGYEHGVTPWGDVDGRTGK